MLGAENIAPLTFPRFRIYALVFRVYPGAQQPEMLREPSSQKCIAAVKATNTHRKFLIDKAAMSGYLEYTCHLSMSAWLFGFAGRV